MEPVELIQVLTSMSAAADLVDAIDYPEIQRTRGWNLGKWDYDCIPWGVRFQYGAGQDKVTITALTFAEPACGRLSRPHGDGLGRDSLVMFY